MSFALRNRHLVHSLLKCAVLLTFLSEPTSADTDISGVAMVNESLAGIPTVTITSNIIEISNRFVFLEDTNAEFTPESILDALDNFNEVPAQGASFGLTPTPYWFALKVQSDLPDPTVVLNISYPLLDYVDIYQYRVNTDSRLLELVAKQQTGDQRVFDTRYRAHRTLNAKILSTAEPSLILVRVKTSGSVQLPAKIYRESSFGDYAAYENAGLFFFYGILAVMAVFNLLLWFQTREPTFLPYVVHLTTYLVYSTISNGTFSQWIAPNFPELSNDLYVFMVGVSLGFGVMFTLQFNAPALKRHPVQKLLKATIVLSVLTAVLSLFLPYQYIVKVAALLGLMVPVLVIAQGTVAYRRGYRPARYFLLGWTSFMLGTITYSLKSLGLIPPFWIAEFGVQIGSAIQVTLLSLALGDRMAEVARERDRLNLENLKTSKALAEESERRSIAERRARAEAETKVMVFSDAVHHLNNPLNHIIGVNQINHEMLELHKGTLNNLLSTDPVDEPTEEVRVRFEKELIDILGQQETIEEAIHRASDTVNLLRILSGIDGVPLHATPISDILFIAARRLPGNRHKLETLGNQEKTLSVIGHASLYAQAIELIERALDSAGLPDIPICIERGTERSCLTWTIGQENKISLQSIEALKRAEELVEHLLRGYSCRLRLSSSAISLELCCDLSWIKAAPALD